MLQQHFSILFYFSLSLTHFFFSFFSYFPPHTYPHFSSLSSFLLLIFYLFDQLYLQLSLSFFQTKGLFGIRLFKIFENVVVAILNFILFFLISQTFLLFFSFFSYFPPHTYSHFSYLSSFLLLIFYLFIYFYLQLSLSFTWTKHGFGSVFPNSRLRFQTFFFPPSA